MSSATPQGERKRFEAVRELLSLLDSEPTVAAVSRRICDLAREQTAARSAIVCLRDQDAHNLRAVPSSAVSPAGGASAQPVDVPRGDAVATCIESAQPATCGAAEIDPAIRSLVPDVSSFSLVPIVRSGACAGVLIVGADDPLSKDDLDLISTLARIAAYALPVEDSDRDALDRIGAAVDAISRLGPYADLTVIRKAVVEATRNALETELVALSMIDPCAGGLDCESTSAVSEDVREAFWDLVGDLVTDRERVGAWVEADVQQDSQAGSEARMTLAESGIRGIIACPVRSEVGASGVLVAFYTSPVSSVDVRARMIESIAAQATATISYALAIEQSRYLLDDLAGANQELSVQATSDGLTGLANHRTLQQKLADLCRRSRLSREPHVFSLVMIDVDHFKLYNDAHGHQEGDAALRAVSRVITSQLRQEDFAARYGGEEFALVLTGIGKNAAQSVARRIKHSVAEHAFSKGRLTVSMGVAEYPADGSTPGEVIERSDRALYHAKITGRNRVVAWGSADSVASDHEPDTQDPKRPNRTVLIVELQAGVGRSLGHMLPSESYTVETSRGSDAAAELLKTHRYDVVLVSGRGRPEDHKCLSTIAAIHPNMPVVLITNDLSVEASRDALRSGASDVFLRPADPAELPVVIERNLERTRVEKQRLAQRSTGLMLQAIEALVAAIDAKDPFTAGHSTRVTSTALAISDHLQISSDERWALELAARLHDIGKLGLPDSALNKQSPLTEEEWQAMREHPALGSRIVGTIDELAYVSTIIRHHHERLDGTGYPDGLRDEAIPYLAQVIAVADAYEAMTAERAHRSPLAPQEAIEELRLHAGTYYASEIVEVLAGLISDSADLPEAADTDQAA